MTTHQLTQLARLLKLYRDEMAGDQPAYARVIDVILTLVRLDLSV